MTRRSCDCGVSRRDMIRIGAGGIGFSLFGGLGPVPFVFNRASQVVSAAESNKILVVFEWFGGNDGLNTIVPYGDQAYYKHRPTIGIAEKDVLKIDAQFGWQKSMGGMKNLYDDGKVAIVQGVGYDQPSFSHFTSESFWHTAAPNSGNEFGWIGRTAAALDPAGARENLIVNVSSSQTLAVKAEKHVPLVFIDPERFQRGVFAQEKVAIEALSAHAAPVGDAHQYVQEVTRSAAQASEVVRAAWSRYREKENSNLRLLDLDKVVALIEADFPTRLYYVPLRNSLFDTHVNQAAPHDRQLQVPFGRHRGVLPGDEADRTCRRRRHVRPQRVRPARARKHELGHRSRHRPGELHHRQRRKGRHVRHPAEPDQPGSRRQSGNHDGLP